MFKPAIDIWFTFYREKTGQEYVFDGKQGKHLKMLLNKIEIKVRQRGIQPTEENILNSFRGLLYSMNDQWVLDHLEISMVNSKFNIIYAKAVKSNPFNRANETENIVRARFGGQQ